MLDRTLLGKIKQEIAEEYGYKRWADINEAYNRFFERDSLSNLVTERYSEEILKRFSKNQKSDDEESRINEHKLLCPRLRNGNECDDPDWDCYSRCTGNCGYMKSFIREIRKSS